MNIYKVSYGLSIYLFLLVYKLSQDFSLGFEAFRASFPKMALSFESLRNIPSAVFEMSESQVKVKKNFFSLKKFSDIFC